MPEPVVISDYVCPVCHGLCDDLTVTLRDGEAPQISPPCERLQDWIAELETRPTEIAFVRGSSASLGDAISEACELLRKSELPLLTGLSATTTDIVRAAVHLAETVDAVIDPCCGTGDSSALEAFQRLGISGASLGEIRQRSDLILFWNADPLRLSERFLDRFCGESDGEFLKQGRADRHLVAIAGNRVDRPEAAFDQWIEWSPEEQVEALASLRLALQEGDSSSLGGDSILSDLYVKLVNCTYGTAFFDFSEFPKALRTLIVKELTLLVRELNDRTRFVMQSLGPETSLLTARQSICWQTGGAGAVRFVDAAPVYDPIVNSAVRVLVSGETDCCVLVGGEWIGRLPESAIAHLSRCDTILLSPTVRELPFQPTVEIRTSTPGYDEPGTITRLDGVPLRLRPLVSPRHLSAAEILDRVRRELPVLGDA